MKLSSPMSHRRNCCATTSFGYTLPRSVTSVTRNSRPEGKDVPTESKTVPPSQLCLECVAAKRQMPIQIHSTLGRRQRRRTPHIRFRIVCPIVARGGLYAARSRDEEIVRFFRSPMGSETEFIQLQQYNTETDGHAKHKVSRSSFSCWPWPRLLDVPNHSISKRNLQPRCR